MRTIHATPLNDEELSRIDRYGRAANYLAVGQIYLMANPLREPLTDAHKPRRLGHWGSTPGLQLLYAHLNRVSWPRFQMLRRTTERLNTPFRNSRSSRLRASGDRPFETCSVVSWD